MPRQRQRWMNIEFRAISDPTVTPDRDHGSYWLEWDDPKVSIELTEEQLRALMTEAMMAQAQAASTAN